MITPEEMAVDCLKGISTLHNYHNKRYNELLKLHKTTIHPKMAEKLKNILVNKAMSKMENGAMLAFLAPDEIIKIIDDFTKEAWRKLC